MSKQDRFEEEKDRANEAYDRLRGYLASCVDVYERASLHKYLEHLFDRAWQYIESIVDSDGGAAKAAKEETGESQAAETPPAEPSLDRRASQDGEA